MTTETKRDPAQAGWSYGSDRVCESTVNRGVCFSRHDEHRGRCVRCGATAPPDPASVRQACEAAEAKVALDRRRVDAERKRIHAILDALPGSL